MPNLVSESVRWSTLDYDSILLRGDAIILGVVGENEPRGEDKGRSVVLIARRSASNSSSCLPMPNHGKSSSTCARPET